jgi:putative sigma-54 modulation protein
VRILIRVPAGLSPSLAPLARHRLEFALRRFGARVRSISVRLADLNGPRGGPDKHCLVTIRLTSPRRLIVIEDTDPDAEVAIGRAADRAARAAARAVQTLTDWRHLERGC